MTPFCSGMLEEDSPDEGALEDASGTLLEEGGTTIMVVLPLEELLSEEDPSGSDELSSSSG